MIKSYFVVLTLLHSMDLFHLGIKHYGLLPENSLECKQSMARAMKRGRDFLESFIEIKTIPWQFSLEGVKYTMTCAMDTVLMTLFLLWHRKVLPDKAIRRHPPPLADILKHVKDGEHALARRLWIDMNTDSVHFFWKVQERWQPIQLLWLLSCSHVQLQTPKVQPVRRNLWVFKL